MSKPEITSENAQRQMARLLTETIGVRDDLDRLLLRMDSRGDAAAEFTQDVTRMIGEVQQLAVRIRQIQFGG